MRVIVVITEPGASSAWLHESCTNRNVRERKEMNHGTYE
jgi:hypothetical protein